MNRNRLVGITLGDINGIGPEVALKAAQKRWPGGTRIVFVGDEAALAREASRLGLAAPRPWSPDAGRPPASRLSVWNPAPHLRPTYRPGRLVASASRAADAWIRAAAQACMENRLHAMVTAPISKEGFHRADIDVPGHTELLAACTGTRRFAMMLFGGPLRVVLATRHIPLAQVSQALTLTPALLRESIRLTHEALPWLGVSRGRIAVCGLNPHAGEGGRIGREEVETIAPVLRGLRRAGLKLDGPLPADTVFHRALRREFAAVIAMYHDQGLAPLKMFAFDTGVNVTLGLPIVRTSPDHGTAFALAGKGAANASSMQHAIRTAIELAGRPNPWRR